MIFSAIKQLLPIFLFSLATVSIVLFVLIKMPGSSLLKFIAVPAALSGVVLMPAVFYANLGYSIAAQFPDDSEFIAYKNVAVNGRKQYVELWVRESSGNRLYRVEWTAALEEQLRAAEAGQQQGAVVSLKKKAGLKPTAGALADNSPRSPYDLEFKTIAVAYPKDPIEGLHNK